MTRIFSKLPTEVLDYTIDWTLRLEGDSIPNAAAITVTSPDVTILTGAKAPTVDGTGQIVTFWISGGASGATAKVRCTVVTTGGRTEAADIFIVIQ